MTEDNKIQKLVTPSLMMLLKTLNWSKNKFISFYSDFKNYLKDTSKSIILFQLGFTVGLCSALLEKYLGKNQDVFTPLFYLMGFIFILAIYNDIKEKRQDPNSKIHKVIIKLKKLKNNFVYKLFSVFIATILAPISFSISQKVVALTTYLPPKFFQNSVAVFTPFIWVLMIILLALMVSMIVMIVPLLQIYYFGIKSVILDNPISEFIKNFFKRFKKSKDKTESKEKPNLFVTIGRLFGFAVIFILVLKLFTFTLGLYIGKKHLDTRRSIIVALDYQLAHHCTNLRGNIHVAILTGNLVSTAEKKDGKWHLKTTECKYLTEEGREVGLDDD